jgi:hypothetical protein
MQHTVIDRERDQGHGALSGGELPVQADDLERPGGEGQPSVAQLHALPRIAANADVDEGAAGQPRCDDRERGTCGRAAKVSVSWPPKSYGSFQVGSKPVTLSAARQLDSVHTSEIRPFGRVRIDPKPADGLIEVIGSVNGILASFTKR